MITNLGKTIMPERFRKPIRGYLQKAGIGQVPYTLYGGLFLITILLTVSAYFVVLFPTLKTGNLVVLVLSTFVILSLVELLICFILILLLWLYYEFLIFKRTREIEEVLPDFLEQVSVNLRVGMSFDKALWNSIEPEFGVLEKEIEIVAKRVMSGEDTEKALEDFSNKYNSVLLRESMDMIIVGLRSGGNISDLIDKIVSNVKEASFLNKELIASVTSYVIFISIIAVLISPILFALSFNLMEIIQSLGAKLSSSSSYGFGFAIGDNKVNPEDFVIFSKLSVMIIAGISSLIIGDLREGSLKAGMKYFFLFIPISFVIYLIALKLLTGVFGVF